MNSITRNQWFAIGILLCTVITGGTAQLTELIGAVGTKTLVSLCTLITGFLAGIQIILGGQAQQIKDVAAMPGVDRVALNAGASLAAAQVAVDPAQSKVEATSPEVRQVLQNTVSKGV